MPTYGGYSERIIVSDKFVVKIPDGLDLSGAAPLLCAGITTWSPLRHWKVGPGSQVAASDAQLTLYLRRASRLQNPNPSRVRIVEGDVLDRIALPAAMRGHDVVYANLSGDMARQAEAIVDTMRATGLKRLGFISSMGIYGEVPGERYRSVLDPYRDSAAIIEASELDYTILRPGWFTRDPEVRYQITQKGEPFKGNDVSLNSLLDGRCHTPAASRDDGAASRAREEQDPPRQYQP